MAWKPADRSRHDSALLAAILIGALGLRLIGATQPIVENYVGRQVPTAMVARNLEQGSGFLRPQLDTAPFPNLFLVEPPIYAGVVVGLRQVTGFALEPVGRLASALGIVFGGWGLFGLVRRREGARAALLAAAAFVLFPVTIRYGRAFQPDALMLGFLVAGMRCWDEFEANGRRGWLVAAGLLLSVGLALKIVAAYILVPLVLVIRPPRRGLKVALAISLVIPAVVWYGYAASVLSAGAGSRASSDNASIWLRVLVPGSLFHRETLVLVARFALRAFTPLGLLVAAAGLWRPRKADRLWVVWGGAALAMLALLAGKLHHEYYWLAVAPMAAVGVGRALGALAARRAAIAGTVMAGLALVQASSTWQTPAEWASLPEACLAIDQHVPRNVWLVAPEALLFEADRRGCRLEYTRAAARRAAGEWGATLDSDDPLELVEFYRAHGARYVADLSATDPSRLALHEAIRRRYNVLVDRPGILLAALPDPQDGSDGNR